VLLIATVVIGLPGKVASGPEARAMVKPMARYFARVAVYLILLNLIMFVDQILLKVLTAGWYRDHGADLSHAVDRVLPKARQLAGFAVEPNALSDVQVAYYRAVQNLARLSYQAIIAATFVIFPLVSKSTFDDDKDTTRRYVTVTMRYSLIFATAIAVVMAANPRPLLDIPYADDYATLGAPALMALALGNVAFSLFAIAGTILNGAGFTRDAIIGAAVTLGLAAVGNLIAIPRCEPGAGGAGGGGLHDRRRDADRRRRVRRVPAQAAGRVPADRQRDPGGAGGGRGDRGRPGHPVHLAAHDPGRGRAVGGVFLVVLVATRELGKADLRSIAAVRAKRGSGGEP
jgi:O-antigen/teichoic acid export membrane protein